MAFQEQDLLTGPHSTCGPLWHPSALPSPSQHAYLKPSGYCISFSMLSMRPWHLSSQSTQVSASSFTSNDPFDVVSVLSMITAIIYGTTFMPSAHFRRSIGRIEIFFAILASNIARPHSFPLPTIAYNSTTLRFLGALTLTLVIALVIALDHEPRCCDFCCLRKTTAYSDEREL